MRREVEELKAQEEQLKKEKEAEERRKKEAEELAKRFIIIQFYKTNKWLIHFQLIIYLKKRGIG
jgi:hypothetical protein